MGQITHTQRAGYSHSLTIRASQPRSSAARPPHPVHVNIRCRAADGLILELPFARGCLLVDPNDGAAHCPALVRLQSTGGDKRLFEVAPCSFEKTLRSSGDTPTGGTGCSGGQRQAAPATFWNISGKGRFREHAFAIVPEPMAQAFAVTPALLAIPGRCGQSRCHKMSDTTNCCWLYAPPFGKSEPRSGQMGTLIVRRS